MSKTIASVRGLGRSVAHRFGREGFPVALVARNQTDLYVTRERFDEVLVAA